MRDRAYARLAALYAGPLRPGDEAAVARLFCDLVDGEAAEGTPLEAMVGRLPPELDQAIRRELGALLAGERPDVEPELDGR
jgi:hypothetical protein